MDLAASGVVDGAIMASEPGFSPLGQSRDLFPRFLGLSEQSVFAFASQNQRVQDVEILCFHPRSIETGFRGVVLTPFGKFRDPSSCASYRPFLDRHPISRDFYYGIAFEALRYLSVVRGARRVAITHLSRSQGFHQDIATCIVEAAGHLLDINPLHAPSAITFVGCCLEDRHFAGLGDLARQSESWHHEVPSDWREVDDDGAPHEVCRLTLNQ